MFEAFTKQWQQGFKPINELATVNAKAIEQLSKQQLELFNTVVKGNMEYAQTLSQQKDLAGVLSSQKDYLHKLQSELNQAGKEAYELALATKEEAQQLLKPSPAEATAQKPTAKAKKAAARKPAAKKAPAKAAAKAEPKSIADEAQLKLQ